MSRLSDLQDQVQQLLSKFPELPDMDSEDFNDSLEHIREQFAKVNELQRAYVEADAAFRAALLVDLEALASGSAQECAPALAARMRAKDLAEEVTAAIKTNDYLVNGLQRRILEQRGLLPKKGSAWERR